LLVLEGICSSWYPRQPGVRKLRAATSPLVTYDSGCLPVVFPSGVSETPRWNVDLGRFYTPGLSGSPYPRRRLD